MCRQIQHSVGSLEMVSMTIIGGIQIENSYHQRKPEKELEHCQDFEGSA